MCQHFAIMLPWGRDMRTAVFLASALVGLLGATAARAQVFDLDADRVPVVELKRALAIPHGG